ncbi:MAG: hypothetical protein GF418_09300 [Chitinivibrionales bacterium]|nr:hypothetical protein [Chitinivibrionales bacterium]MBD3395804.1 hypothetical protein [Chitinivibrionales bacterium]
MNGRGQTGSMLRTAACLIAATIAPAHAAPHDTAAGLAPSFRMSGDVSAELSYVVNSSDTALVPGSYETTYLSGMRMSSLTGVLRLNGTYQKLDAEVSVVGAQLIMPPDPTRSTQRRNKYSFNRLLTAYGAYSFGDADAPQARLSIGYFPFSYSGQTRSLGSYLFRSGTYPGYVFSGDSTAYLAGLHFETSLPGILRHDLFLTTEVEWDPQYDVSLSYLARIGVDKPFEFDAGVFFDRLVPVYSFKTSPEELPHLNGTIIEAGGEGDTVYYTKQGVRLMGRFRADLKHFFTSERFSPQDLVVYTEAALLGVKNYPGFYDDVTERVPAMIGFNIPTARILDVLSVELEYYGSPWRNDPSHARPKPYENYAYETITYASEGTGWRGTRNDYKWHVYAQRTLLTHITVSARVASDHLRGLTSDGSIYPYERLHGYDEWYWSIGARVSF